MFNMTVNLSMQDLLPKGARYKNFHYHPQILSAVCGFLQLSICIWKQNLVSEYVKPHDSFTWPMKRASDHHIESISSL